MITLHHCPQTRSMRTLWLLHELGEPFDVVVHPFGKKLRNPSYLSKSPAGRVPALQIDNAYMFETGAITEFLCESFPKAGLGRADGHPDRKDWLVWVHFAETISQHAAALTQQHIMLYEDDMRSPIVMKLEAARLSKCYDAVEACLASDGLPNLLGELFSAADISVGQAIYMSQHFCKLDAHPATQAWMQRLQDRPGFQASLPKDNEDRLYSKPFYAAWDAR